MEAQLRTARAEDSPALAELMRVTFSDTFRHYRPDELASYLAEHYSEARVRERLAVPTRRTWVVEREGDLIAYAVAGDAELPLVEITPASGQLHRLYVRADAKRTGLGRRLMEAALGWLEEQQRSPLYIGVWEHNLAAQAFYRGYGFEPVGEYPYPVGSTIDRELILRRR